jgi:hypothetical protein
VNAVSGSARASLPQFERGAASARLTVVDSGRGRQALFGHELPFNSFAIATPSIVRDVLE